MEQSTDCLYKVGWVLLSSTAEGSSEGRHNYNKAVGTCFFVSFTFNFHALLLLAFFVCFFICFIFLCLALCLALCVALCLALFRQKLGSSKYRCIPMLVFGTTLKHEFQIFYSPTDKLYFFPFRNLLFVLDTVLLN